MPRRLLFKAAGFFAILSAVSTVLGFLGEYHWVFDLFSHFRIQYFLCGFLAGGVLYFASSRRLAAVAAVVAMVNLATIIPLYPTGKSKESKPVTTHEHAVLLLNLNSENRRSDAVISYVETMQPDVLAFLEFNARWRKALTRLEADYPYRLTYPRLDNFGIAVYAKEPLTGEIIHQFRVPAVSARLANGVDLYVTHPPPPISTNWAAARDIHLERLGHLASNPERPTLVVGDFNASPWSVGYRLFRDGSGFEDCARQFGFTPTWPSHFYPLRIAIDHCFHSSDLQITARKVGPHVGSDHYPIFVGYQLGVNLPPAPE
ncbi:MAG: endonuclease/exonuclease/phosphatase family protein [Pseudomonadota bacterium]